MHATSGYLRSFENLLNFVSGSASGGERVNVIGIITVVELLALLCTGASESGKDALIVEAMDGGVCMIMSVMSWLVWSDQLQQNQCEFTQSTAADLYVHYLNT